MEKTINFLNNQRYILGDKGKLKVYINYKYWSILLYTIILGILFFILFSFSFASYAEVYYTSIIDKNLLITNYICYIFIPESLLYLFLLFRKGYELYLLKYNYTILRINFRCIKKLSKFSNLIINLLLIQLLLFITIFSLLVGVFNNFESNINFLFFILFFLYIYIIHKVFISHFQNKKRIFFIILKFIFIFSIIGIGFLIGGAGILILCGLYKYNKTNRQDLTVGKFIKEILLKIFQSDIDYLKESIFDENFLITKK